MLAFDKTRAKARYRRGLAYEGLGCYDNALKDLQAVVRTFFRVCMYMTDDDGHRLYVYETESVFHDTTTTRAHATPQYASDTSLAVEDAVDRVELRKTVRGLQCEWTPEALTALRQDTPPPSGVPSRADMGASVVRMDTCGHVCV